MAGRKDLSNLLSEASLTLLRQQNQWTACSYSNEVFSQGNMRSAEPAFQKLVSRNKSSCLLNVTVTNLLLGSILIAVCDVL